MDKSGNVQVLTQEVLRIVTESGEVAGFNAPAWLATWLNSPLPALAGRRPSDLLDDPAGFETVLTLIRRLQSNSVS